MKGMRGVPRLHANYIKVFGLVVVVQVYDPYI